MMRSTVRAVGVVPVPLCVDLDGTLVNTDTLVELALKCATRRPLSLWRWPGWILKGKAHFKKKISELVSLDPRSLPYNDAVIAYLEAQSRTGRSIVLATGADVLVARSIADHLGYFEEVIASDGVVNRVGRSKLKSIEERFGRGRFAYMGNAQADESIWSHAAEAILVNLSEKRVAALSGRIAVSQVIGAREWSWPSIAKALRVHQWAKNLLIFVPLFLAHELTEVTRSWHAIVAFWAFSLSASSTYVLNDLVDLEADRRHHEKRSRPFASGTVPVAAGVVAAPALATLGLTLGWSISPAFMWVLISYMLLTVTYSLYLKRCMVVDVLALSACYGVRLVAGGTATGVELSKWLLAFAGFLFISLAFLKRFVEVRSISAAHVAKARGYRAEDAQPLGVLGMASGYIATLVLALYVNGEEVTAHYSSPPLLWLMCPLMVYWVSRVWLLAYRGDMVGDPVMFAVEDRPSYLVAVLAALLVAIATWL